MFLQVNNLSKKYGAKTVLENISFNQEKGEIISLIGTSGIGKSTLLKCLAGLCGIDSGNITLNSNKIHNLEANNRKISFVFQERFSTVFYNSIFCPIPTSNTIT